MSDKYNIIKEMQDTPVIIANEIGVVTYVNKAFEKVFGWREGEIVGEALTMIIPSHLHDAHHLGFSRFISTEQATILEQSLDLLAVNKSGKEFNATHVICGKKINNQWSFAASISPIK
ncbi:PAS domain S-box protein [Thiotrichales bacterium 19S9-12]|nr:PAS domain S-box protein [Thiotrichales bacterium 19S9-11]MCF6810989.1 PAS domain S-box protein [Thiotrichales bacterium 19S9-12]